MIVCRTCGRVVDTAGALDPLVAEEHRCPRCGRSLAAQWPRELAHASTDRPDDRPASQDAELPEPVHERGGIDG